MFLYAPTPSSPRSPILNLDEAGEIGPAAAMATLIVATSTVVCLLYALVTRVLLTPARRRGAPPAACIATQSLDEERS